MRRSLGRVPVPARLVRLCRQQGRGRLCAAALACALPASVLSAANAAQQPGSSPFFGEATGHRLTELGTLLVSIVGVNFSSGETDRQLVLNEQEPNYTDDEAANPSVRFAVKKSVVTYPF